MKSLIGAVVCVLLAASALHAQSRFEDVRLVVGRHGVGLTNPGFDEVKGVLIIDTTAGRLRFEAPDRPALDLSLHAVLTSHYEESSFPKRALRRHGLYLTVFHVGAGGEAEVAIFRLPGSVVADCLAALERGTGQLVDRTPTTTSFVGLPIQVGIGDVVYVTQSDGRRTKGTVTRLDVSGISLGALGRFDELAVRRIDVSDPIWDGVMLGAVIALTPAGLAALSDCSDSCSQAGFLTPAGWGIVAAGALIGGAIDKNAMRHAYRKVEPRHSFWVTPAWTPRAAGVVVMLDF